MSTLTRGGGLVLSQELFEEIAQVSSKVNSLMNRLVPPDKRPKPLYEASRHLLVAGGKRLRPFLVVESSRVFGNVPEAAYYVAAGIELLHSFTLVHDDIMDQDQLRRGVPTVHVVWGVPMAILAGDLLFAKVYEAVLLGCVEAGLSHGKALEVLNEITKAILEICEGQALDMMFEETESVSEEEYLVMVEKKTAALFKASARCGALVSDAAPEYVDAIGEFARYCGIAFQIVDDVLGVVADEKKLGKPVGSDLREGKRTMIVIKALEALSSEERAKLLKVLGNRSASQEEIKEVIDLLVSSGCVDYAKQVALSFLERAKQELLKLPPGRSRDRLLDLASFLVERAY